MALTRILRGASSSASPFVGVSMAPFVDAYYGMRAHNGAEVDDATAVRAEPLDRLLHGENGSQNADVVVEVEALFGDFREGAETEYSGVVDQNV